MTLPTQPQRKSDRTDPAPSIAHCPDGFQESQQAGADMVESSRKMGDTSERAEIHQITIKEMLAITFVCAAAIALVRHFWIGGAVALFVFSFAVSTICRASQQLQKSQVRFINEVLWGCMMPIACLVTDFLVFQDALGFPGQDLSDFWARPPWTIASLFFIIWQIVHLMGSWFLGGHPFLANWFVGTFIAGSLFASMIGLLLLPLSIIGLMAVIGVLGFTPLFTGFVFWKAVIRMHGVCRVNDQRKWGVIAAGFLTAVILPVITISILTAR